MHYYQGALKFDEPRLGLCTKYVLNICIKLHYLLHKTQPTDIYHLSVVFSADMIHSVDINSCPVVHKTVLSVAGNPINSHLSQLCKVRTTVSISQ